MRPAFRRTLRRLAWLSLVVALLSGALWLLLEARSMSGRSLAEVLAQHVVTIVLERTQFGHVWQLRAALLVLLAALLAASDRIGGRAGGMLNWALLLLGAAVAATLAWAGHAGATQGDEGKIHLVVRCAPSAGSERMARRLAAAGAALRARHRRSRMARHRPRRDAAFLVSRHRLRRHAAGERRGQ